MWCTTTGRLESLQSILPALKPSRIEQQQRSHHTVRSLLSIWIPNSFCAICPYFELPCCPTGASSVHAASGRRSGNPGGQFAAGAAAAMPPLLDSHFHPPHSSLPCPAPAQLATHTHQPAAHVCAPCTGHPRSIAEGRRCAGGGSIH